MARKETDTCGLSSANCRQPQQTTFGVSIPGTDSTPNKHGRPVDSRFHSRACIVRIDCGMHRRTGIKACRHAGSIHRSTSRCASECDCEYARNCLLNADRKNTFARFLDQSQNRQRYVKVRVGADHSIRVGWTSNCCVVCIGSYNAGLIRPHNLPDFVPELYDGHVSPSYHLS